jgi:hypothetical protein
VTLRRGQQRLTTDQKELNTRVDGLADVVTNLGQIVGDLHRERGAKGDGDASSPPRVCWMEPQDPDVADAVMDDLLGWLQRVYVQFNRPLPACWEWHPDVIESLLALRHAHWAAYQPKAPAQAAVDWITKALPEVAKYIAGAVSKSHTLEDHLRGSHLVPIPMPGSAGRVAAAWADRGEDWAFTGPEPTELETREADRHLGQYARGGSRTA